MKQFYKILLFTIFLGSHNYSSGSALNYNLGSSERLVAPTATVNTDATSVCLNGTTPTITFTGSGGTAPYTFTYKIGSGASQSIVSAGTGNTATVIVPTTVAGSFVYTLESVADATPTTVTITSQSVTIIVYALPSINGTLNTCVSATSNLNGTGTAATTNPWTSSNPSVATVSNTGLVTGITAGTTIITYKNADGCDITANFTVKALPTVDFSFTNNQCSGSAIQFNSTVSGGGPYTYSWNFGDGDSSSSQNPTHTFTSLGCGTATFNVSLTVTGTNGCPKTITKVVTIQQQPDVSVEDLNAGSANQFSNCANTTNIATYSITVGNTSVSSSCISTYSINWGDTNTSSNVTFPITHIYNIRGVFNMVVTATSSNGCINSKTYIVKNISNPSGGILNPGGTSDMCLPAPIIQYSIGNWALNSPGTTYDIDYGDNLPHLLLIQDNMINTPYYNASNPSTSSNYPVPYAYTTVSCPNSEFIIKIIVTNACKTTTGTVVGGNTIKKPTANFTAPATSCISTSVLFTNTTILGYDVDCKRDTKFIWDFGDPASGTSNTITTGFITTTPNVNHTFSSPGLYTVTLSTRNSCGATTFSQQICIESPLLPQFTLNPSAGCTPLAVATTNTTSLTNTCPGNPTYLWNVTYASGYCGSIVPPNLTSSIYTNGTSATSANPSFSFITPGTYSISLTTTNSCGPVTSAVQTVIVKQPPTVAITSIPDVCLGTTITPTIAVNSCSNLALPTSPPAYSWTATVATPSTSNATTPPTFSYATPGTYTISLSVTNECSSSTTTTTASRTFTVKPLPTATISDGITVCLNAASPTITFVATSNSVAAPNTTTPPYIFTYNINGVGNQTVPTAATSNSATVSVPTNISGTFIYNLLSVQNSATPSCSQTMSGSTTVVVNPAAQVNQPINQVVCNNSVNPATNFTTANSTGATTYTWTNNTAGIGLAASGSGDVPSFTATNTTTSPIIATITVTPSYSFASIICPGPSTTYTITVNPTGQVIQPTNVVYCNTNITTAIPFTTTNTVGTTTYAWTNNTTGIGLAASGTGPIPSFTATNTTTSPIVATITVTPTFSNGSVNCAGIAKTFTITVNPSPAITFSPTTQSICSGTSSVVTTLNSTTTGVTFAWTTTQPVGITETIALSGSGTIPAQTFTNTTNADIIVTYNATATVAGVSACAGAEYFYTITVKPKPAIANISALAICSGTSFNVTPSSTSPNIIPLTTTYSWGAPTVTGVLTGGVAASNQTTITGTLNNPTNSSQTATYTVTPSYGTSPNICSGTAFTVVVTVNPKPIIPAQTETICSETAFTLTPVNNAPTIIVPSGTTYSWSAPVVAGITALASGNNQTSISGTLINTTNAPINVTYSITATSGTNPNTCSSTFNLVVTVNPRPLIPNQTSITCSGTAFTVPLTNAPPTLILPTGTTYTWTVASVTGINGTSNQITPGVSAISQVLTNTTNAPIDVLYNVTASSGTTPNNCTSTFTVTVTVNPTPFIPIQTSTICSGTAFTFTPVNGSLASTTIVPSGTTYSWPAPVVLGITGLAAGNNQTSISGTLTNTTNAPINVTYSITATSGTNPNTCTSTFTITVTVNPSPSVTFSPAAQTICSGDTTALVTLSSTTPGVTFSWTATSNAILPSDISSFSTSGTNTIPVQTLVNSTASAITITYVATASTGGSSACAGTTYNYTIIVNPRPAIAGPVTQSVCSATLFTVTPSSTSPNIIPLTTTYSWGAPTVTGGLTGGVAASNQTTITGTLNNPTNSVQTATYTVTPFANGCSGATFTVVVTVNPKPIIPAQTETICSETAFTVTPVNNAPTIIVPSGTTYSWSAPTAAGITGLASGNNQTSISGTLTNTTNAPINVTYSITATSGTNPNTCSSTFNLVVTVNPRPLIPNQTSITCSGTAFSVPLTNAPPTLILPTGTTYTWTVDSVTGINGTSNQIAPGVSTISQVLTNTTNAPIDVLYNVTASSGTSPNNCTSTTFTVTVTVNPKPILPAQTIVRCSGTIFTVTPVNNLPTTVVPSGTTYSWPAPVVTGITGAAAGINQTSITGSLTNTTTAPINVVFSITASSGTAPNNCTSTFNLTVTVNPSPSVSFLPATQTICSGDSTALVTLSSTTPGVTFSWTAANVLGITGIITSSTPGTTTIPVQTLTNTTSAPISVIYSATATTASGASCLGATSDYTIIVNPKPAIENQTITICNNQSFTINPINGIPTSSTIVPVGALYTWTIIPNLNITGASDGSAASISQTLTNTSNTLQSIVYNVIPSYLNCNGDVFTITVSVNPTPSTLFSITNQTICNNTQSTAINLSSDAAGTINYSWICTNPPSSSDLTGLILSGTTTTIPTQLLVNNTPNPITITYQVIAEISGINACAGPPSFSTITINPTFQASGVISNYNGYGVSFFGGTDGFIDLTVTGGSGVYTYSWTGANFTATTQDINGVPAGTYNVSISDGYCSPIVLTFTLTQPPELLVQQDLSLTINATCFGQNNGAVGILITQESVPPYDYELYNSAGVLVASIPNSTNLNPQFTGLAAGTYTIKVIDANNGIKTVYALIVTEPNDILITATTTPITCYGANNASITLTVSGGTAPYTAQWNNLATGFYQNNLAAGTYTILVTDGNNCTKSISVLIPEALLFTVNPVVRNISCFGANDGSINLNFVGGIPAINLTWSDGSTAGTTRNNLGPGTYSVTIIDGTPCTIFRTFTIVEPQPLVVTASLNNAFDCLNPNSGAINLIVSGGTTPYSYNWSNGSTAEDLISITSGNYQVTVSDLNGCTNTKQYSIIRPAPIDITVTTQTTHNCDAHTVVQSFVAQASGGVPGYTYQWSNGQTGPVLNTAINGTYQLTVTDSYGCQKTETVIVDIPVLGYVTFNQTSIGYTSYGLYAIGDPITFTSTITGDYISVYWDFGDGTFSSELNPTHTYNIANDYIVTLTVTYPFGCVYIQTISLFVEEGYVLVVPTAFTPNNDTLNDTMRPVTKGLKNVQMDIYDTWGSLLYSETGDVLVGWDATIKGFNAENGNYYCKVKGETFYGTTVYSNQTFVLIK